MKSILLTTTALVAFAGVAAADGHTNIGLSGNASVGFNDKPLGEDGFYWDSDIDVSLSATLDNGLTAGASFELDIVDDENAETVSSDEFVLSLESDTAGLFFGDTSFAAQNRWVGAGDMEADAFSVAGVDASVSYAVTHALGDAAPGDGFVNAPLGTAATDAGFETNDEFVDQLSLGVAGDFGMFAMSAAYQEESVSAGTAAAAAGLDAATIDALVAANLYAPGVANGDFTENEVFGVSAGVSVAGADITLAYAQKNAIADEDDESSTGIQIAYPFGPVTTTVYFVSEDDGSDEDNFGATVAYADGPIAVTLDYDNDQGLEKVLLEGAYDVGNGLTLFAGALNENEGDDVDYFVAGQYDRGGGASILASFAKDEDKDQADEIGSDEYLPGTTVELSFAF